MAAAVDGIVAALAVDLSAGDVECGLRLYALAVGRLYVERAASDEDVAVDFQALWRRLVVGVDAVGVSSVVVVDDVGGIDADAALCGYVECAVVHGEGTVGADALASSACTLECERSAVDGDIAVESDGGRSLGLRCLGAGCGLFPDASAAGGGTDVAAFDADVAVGLDALGGIGRHAGADGSAEDVDVARVFVLVVGGLARRSGAVELSLDAVVGHATHVDCAAFHEEILGAVDAVALGFQHVHRAVLDAKVLSRLDSMLLKRVDVECSLAFQLGVSFHYEAGFLSTSGTVAQCVLGVFLDADGHSLAVLNVDGGPAGVGETESAQLDGGLVGAAKRQFTIVGSAAQRVGNLAHVVGTDVGALHDAHMSTAHYRLHILCHVAGHGHAGCCSVVAHAHFVVGHFGVVDIHPRDVSQLEHLSHDGQGGAVGIVHRSGLSCRELVCDASRHHVQRLRLCCYRQHQCYQDGQFLHFTVILMVFPSSFIM